MEYFSSTSTKKPRTTGEWGKMVSGGQRSRADTKTVMPRTPTFLGIKSPIREQMVSLQQKIQLLEYDHKAYQESADHIIKENQETIKFLQQENNKLNQELAQEKQRQAEREAKNGQVILQIKESKLHDNIKLLNTLSHQAQVHEKHLEELESLLKHNSTVMQNNKTTKDEQIQHLLENKLGDARLKLQDVEHINSVYRKITTHLQEKIPTFQPQIQQLETEIPLFRNELKDLKNMKKNAVMSRDTAWAEFQHLKKEYRCKRSKREQLLRDLTHQANERRHYEKEQAKSWVFIRDQAPIDACEVSPAQEEEERICTYEEALEKIKEATGVMNKHEVLQRFIKMQETRKYLEKEKLMTETTLSELKDKQEKMDNVLQDLKYTKQAKFQDILSKNLKTLEDLQTQLLLESKKQDKFKMEAEKVNKVLNKATSEVKRLATRLRHIKLPGANFPVKDLCVLDILLIMGQKLQNLKMQIEGQDIEEIFKEMEDEEFVDTFEHNLPARIPLLLPAKQDKSDDEESEKDYEAMTRASMKKISQQIAMSNRRANLWCDKWLK